MSIFRPKTFSTIINTWNTSNASNTSNKICSNRIGTSKKKNMVFIINKLINGENKFFLPYSFCSKPDANLTKLQNFLNWLDYRKIEYRVDVYNQKYCRINPCNKKNLDNKYCVKDTIGKCNNCIHYTKRNIFVKINDDSKIDLD